jgi:hypothetical protein
VRSTKPTTTTKAQAPTTPQTTPSGSPVVPKEPTTPYPRGWVGHQLRVLGVDFTWINHKLTRVRMFGHDPANPQWVVLTANRDNGGGWVIIPNSWPDAVHRIPAGPKADQQAVDYIWAHMHRL